MITTPPVDAERRRSHRIPVSVPLFVLSLDSLTFCAHSRTVEVSGHGCVLHAVRPFKRGTRLRLDVLSSNQTTTARVVHSDPTGTHETSWTIALELDKPGNYWRVTTPPADWPRLRESSA